MFNRPAILIIAIIYFSPATAFFGDFKIGDIQISDIGNVIYESIDQNTVDLPDEYSENVDDLEEEVEVDHGAREVNGFKLESRSSFFTGPDPRKYYDNETEPYTGVATYKYKDGGYRTRIFKGGVFHGESRLWWPNGNLSEVVIYKDGVKNIVDLWFENGNKKEHYHYNLILRTAVHAKPWQTHWDNGQMKKEILMHSDEKPSEIKVWTKNGQLIKHSKGMKHRRGLRFLTEDHYVVERDNDGNLDTFYTRKPLNIGGEKICYFDYQYTSPTTEKFGSIKDINESKTIIKSGVHQVSGIFEECLPRAYKYCKNSGVSDCDKYFLQGKYSQRIKDYEYKKNNHYEYDRDYRKDDRESINEAIEYRRIKLMAKDEIRDDLFNEIGVKRPVIKNKSELVAKIDPEDSVWKYYYNGERYTGVSIGERYYDGSGVFKTLSTIKNGLPDGIRWDFHSNGRPIL